MSHKSNKPLFAAGAALAGSLILAGSAFAATPLAQGYMLGAQHADAKQDAAAKTTEAACGAKHADGAKHAEGKCGEGKCGMARMDTDKDGKLSPAEFAAAHKGDSSQFAAHDRNADGFIDAAEMKAHHGDMKSTMPVKAAMEGKCGEGKCGAK